MDDSDDEEEETLTGEGKKMKKALRKVDTMYDSDEEGNPYASSVCHPLCSNKHILLTARLSRRRKKKMTWRK